MSSCYDLTDLQYGLLQRAVHFQRTGVGLEVALRRDQVHQLGGQVHVGLLQRGGLDGTESTRVGSTRQGITGEQGLAPGGVPHLGQPLGVGELGHGHHGHLDGGGVAVSGGDYAIRPDLHLGQATDGGAVLGQLAHFKGGGVLGHGAELELDLLGAVGTVGDDACEFRVGVQCADFQSGEAGGGIATAEKGLCWLKVRATGQPGHGSVPHGQNALEKLNAGASLVQLYTGFIYEGPALIKAINKKILNQQ